MKRLLQMAMLVGLAVAIGARHREALGQREGVRQFAPGVLTTIAPAPEAHEMVTGPVALAELPVAIEGLEYDPKIESKSATVFERSKTVTMHESYLVRTGLVVRTEQGRALTPEGVEYLRRHADATSNAA